MEGDRLIKMTFEEGMKEIEKLIINNIFEYLKIGDFPVIQPNIFLKAVFIVELFADKGNDNKLYDYHNKTIENYVIECTKKLSSGNINLDEYFFYTKNINFLIYWMNRIFGYLDRWYTKVKVKVSLSEGAMKIYKSILFEKLKSKIFIEVGRLINEERKGNIESKNKIKKFLEIFNDLNLEHPQIIK